ncbi:response regulator [Sporolituus thermophilus]|uniref:Two-component system, chemotaxis family, response regulator CheY n=1 Tax=Sporolituus thermophilus DSM 23256 TaxID=1123285 RepID=A0A1G7JT36_9FIRM|nr:response regulator [Sporolituus thermophilus]SDF28066.1 two-component system, chemotaxis family, response regulator CheY [Sporolituus thermophilus DSM 23256]
MDKVRVLVVDDSPFIHRAVARAFKNEEKFELVGSAYNGKEGSAMYFDLKPDVVIMDITMPVMDGLAAAQEILGKDNQARIIFQSAMGDDELVKKAREMGVKEFIQKPFKDDELKNIISALV